jgi:hypothetical protein
MYERKAIKVKKSGIRPPKLKKKKKKKKKKLYDGDQDWSTINHSTLSGEGYSHLSKNTNYPYLDLRFYQLPEVLRGGSQGGYVLFNVSKWSKLYQDNN